jgi:biopolymer transport protein ExbD
MTSTKYNYYHHPRVDEFDAALVGALRDAMANTEDKVVILAGDREVVLGEVVRVLGLAKEAGASGFALASE